eukprot:TRINITY_DN4840_c0_g1_i7.p1 TRINITY_DN4840_c0_g1~~TRINITY_DN4840_c0_g1_i7.p1  ORF type:complete len:190 (+),score=26.01 TRINITY_DN4840_c0_g1_i7:40-609(+)
MGSSNTKESRWICKGCAFDNNVEGYVVGSSYYCQRCGRDHIGDTDVHLALSTLPQVPKFPLKRDDQFKWTARYPPNPSRCLEFPTYAPIVYREEFYAVNLDKSFEDHDCKIPLELVKCIVNYAMEFVPCVDLQLGGRCYVQEGINGKWLEARVVQISTFSFYITYPGQPAGRDRRRGEWISRDSPRIVM